MNESRRKLLLGALALPWVIPDQVQRPDQQRRKYQHERALRVPRPKPIDLDRVPEYVPEPHVLLSPVVTGDPPSSIQIEGQQWLSGWQPMAYIVNLESTGNIPNAFQNWFGVIDVWTTVADNVFTIEYSITNQESEAIVNSKFFAGPILDFPDAPSYRPATGAATDDEYPLYMSLEFANQRVLFITSKTGDAFHKLLLVGNGVVVLQVDRLEPGETIEFKVQLRWAMGSHASIGLVEDVFQQFTELHPNVQDWSDRRPIGNSFPCQAPSGSNFHPPENPRGWISQVLPAGTDINTPDGLAIFRAGLLNHADICIQRCLGMDAQGCIVWCIEGQRNAHPISYIGDPRRATEFAPEISTVVREFFQRFVRAGLRPGVTIRPQVVKPVRWNVYRLWQHDTLVANDETFRVLHEKMDYARRNWGVTIFYVDSNLLNDTYGHDYGNQGIVPGSIYRRLAKQFPDCLILPEQTKPNYHGAVSAFRANYAREPSFAKLIDKSSFGVMLGQAEAPHVDPASAERLASAIGDGQIVMFNAWWENPANAVIETIYKKHRVTYA